MNPANFAAAVVSKAPSASGKAKPVRCGVMQTFVIGTTPPRPSTSPNIPKQAQASGIKRKVFPICTGGGGDNYDAATVQVLISCLRKAGYGNRVGHHKNMKAMFAAAVELAEKDHGIVRSADGWMKKFKRIRNGYSDNIAKIEKSGRDGDDEDLYDKPEFYDIIQELEFNKARHNPPAILSTAILGYGADDVTKMTSSKKRKKREKDLTLAEFAVGCRNARFI